MIVAMPRMVSRPPFPNTPGTWLASFRYRRWIEGEDMSSPEQIGESLGVSGPTVRRWETGQSQPSHFDLQRFADLCRLSAIEKLFLLRAFSAKETEPPPSQDSFQETATRVLNCAFPAYLMDSFFFVRANNSYMDALDGQPLPAMNDSNILRGPLMALARPNETEDQEQRLWRWLRDFWFSTADLCGSVPYQRLLRELCAMPNFEHRWRQLALTRHSGQDLALHTPYTYKNSRVGAFAVFASEVIIPPEYHLRVYVPLDEQATDRVARVRKTGEPEIRFDREAHWTSRLLRTF
jgi:transcriptional regulator with XRE-family HTH domain